MNRKILIIRLKAPIHFFLYYAFFEGIMSPAISASSVADPPTVLKIVDEEFYKYQIDKAVTKEK